MYFGHTSTDETLDATEKVDVTPNPLSKPLSNPLTNPLLSTPYQNPYQNPYQTSGFAQRTSLVVSVVTSVCKFPFALFATHNPPHNHTHTHTHTHNHIHTAPGLLSFMSRTKVGGRAIRNKGSARRTLLVPPPSAQGRVKAIVAAEYAERSRLMTFS